MLTAGGVHCFVFNFKMLNTVKTNARHKCCLKENPNSNGSVLLVVLAEMENNKTCLNPCLMKSYVVTF